MMVLVIVGVGVAVAVNVGLRESNATTWPPPTVPAIDTPIAHAATPAPKPIALKIDEDA